MNIPTMSLVVAIASMLHAIVLLFFFFLARQYRGIGCYAVGTMLSAFGFLCFLIRLFHPEWLILRCLGNILVSAGPLCYTTGISRFIGRREHRFLFILLGTILTIHQIYHTYQNDSFFARNLSVILIVIFSDLAATYFLLQQRAFDFRISVYFTIFVLLLNSLFLSLRIVVLSSGSVQSLFAPNVINIFTFWSIFICDYLRHTGFMMMVSQRLYKDLQKLADFDYLTNLLNRRSMNFYLKKQMAYYEQKKQVFSLILIDVDRFKSINDEYGHEAGDFVLKHLAATLTQNLRCQEIISRWGGEEFLILLPHTILQDARSVAERLRVKIAKTPTPEKAIQYTISLGVATFIQHGTTLDKVIDAADKALYRAKHNGRNRVEIASDSKIEA
jgi:diguanylate cyclase (GGDEF)-like protein